MHLSFDMLYNDGVAAGDDTPHDWSHGVFGISTGFKLTENLTFTPGFYYQSSWENAVNEGDEYWTRLSMTYEF